MSLECMAWAVKQTAGSTLKKAVLMNMANSTNHQTAICRPRLKLMATEIESSVPAIQKAAHMLLPVQIQRIAIPRRFTMPMQEIWALQERLPYRYGKRAETVLAHPRFRAAYDFLLLREDAGEDTGNLGQWWTDYQFASEPDRRRMITELSGPVRKSRRPRKRKARTTGPAGSNH